MTKILRMMLLSNCAVFGSKQNVLICQNLLRKSNLPNLKWKVDKLYIG